MTRVNAKTINTCLLVAILLVNGYIIALPVAPLVSFWVDEHLRHKQDTLLQIVSSMQPNALPSTSPQNATPTEQTNRLIVPSMQLDEPFYEGPDQRTLSKGLWLRPHTSTPDKQSNTVIAGHRFTYTNPRASFYFLHKVHVGDVIAIFWHNTRYTYQVTATKVVGAGSTYIEDPSSSPRLTLYTCTPLWNPTERLVVIAEPKETP